VSREPCYRGIAEFAKAAKLNCEKRLMDGLVKLSPRRSLMPLAVRFPALQKVFKPSQFSCPPGVGRGTPFGLQVLGIG
jgi:hypothetical protein